MSGSRGRFVAGPVGTFDDYPVDLAWLSPQRLVVGGGEGRLAAIDAGTGELQALGEHAPGLLRLAPLAAGAFVTTGQDGSVRRWAADGAVRTLHRGTSWVEALAVAGDGARFAFAAGKTLQVHAADGELMRSFHALPRAPSLAAWRGRFAEVALAAGTQAWLCELDSGRVTQIDLEGGAVTLAFSPDGRVLATGLQDGVVSFRNVATQKKSRMSGYDGKVTHTSWSANGRYLATAASGASTTVVWDFSGKGPEGSTPLQLGTHTDRLEAVEFQPGDKALATAARDGRLALWWPSPAYRVTREGAPLPQALDVQSIDGVPALLRWSPDGRRIALACTDGRIALFDVELG